jgi:hypothetical protein
MATVITLLQIPVRPEFVTEESKNPTFPRSVALLSGSFLSLTLSLTLTRSRSFLYLYMAFLKVDL